MVAVAWHNTKDHLEVRPGDREKSEIGTVFLVEGPLAKCQRDWVYWRLPTIFSVQKLDASQDAEINVRFTTLLLSLTHFFLFSQHFVQSLGLRISFFTTRAAAHGERRRKDRAG
jgi:hypothetical protein